MKLIYYQLAFLLSLIISQTKNCQEGCLKCDSSLNCLICDSQNGYKFQENQCQFIPISNCFQYDLEGNCSICDPNFYFNKSKNLCMQIDDQVSNCLYYNSQKDCSRCQEEYYLHKKKCINVDTIIKYCKFYFDSQHCQQCQEGYTLNLMKNQCFENPKIQNCAKFTLNQCQICDFFKNDFSIINKRIEKNIENSKEKIKVFYESFYNQNFDYEEICTPIEVENCQTYISSKECSQCKKEYYLEDNKCMKVQAQKISNCEMYKDSQTCLICIQGYHLSEQKHCLQNQIIKNCQDYSQISLTTQCLICKEGFYLNNQKCIKRTKEIINCKVYKSNNDNCQDCDQQYQLTDDNLKCLKTIDNCKLYEQNDVNTQQLKCINCNEKYFLENQQCVQGQITNCLIYGSVNKCDQCINGYYLNNNKCLIHDKIIFCDIYDKFLNQKCSQCISNSLLFTFDSTCVKSDLIDNCIDYDNQGNCIQCQDKYNLVDNNCILFTHEKCLQQIEGVCTKCKEAFELNQGVCNEVEPLQEQYCQQKKIENGKEICLSCTQQAISYNFQYHIQCKQISQFVQQYQVIQNCLVYEQQQNDQNLICKKCQKDFYLKNNQCIQICEDSIHDVDFEYDQNNKVIFVNQNLCKSITNNCKIITPFTQQNQDQLQQSCKQCVDGFTQLLKNTDNSLLTLNKDLILQIPEIQCLNIQTSELSYQNDNLIQNCEYYQNLYNNKIGCQKCKHLYNGQIKNWSVKNCKEYDVNNRVCSKCNNQYKLSQNKLECNQMPEIQNCLYYKENEINICEKCQNNFYLENVQSCKQLTEVPNCQSYHLTLDQCVECISQHKFNNVKSFCYPYIEHCLDHIIPQQHNDDVHCRECEDGYYPFNKTCQQGNVQFCWRYDQTKINKCSYYINFVSVNFTRQCSLIQQMEGCKRYESKNSCELCDSDQYYLTNGKCCKYEKFLNEISCDQIQIPNCSISRTGGLSCDQCKSGYFFDIYQDELNPAYKCCQRNSYWNPNINQCSSIVDLSLNIINCEIYSWVTRTCTKCKQGYYLSGKNLFCSPNFKYHIIENFQHKFNDVSTHIPDCMQYDPETSKCLKCKEFQQGDQYVYELTENTRCCKQYYQHELNNQCNDNPTGCKAVDTNKTDCLQCHNDYFLQSKVCCHYKNTNDIEFYDSDNTQCSVMQANDKISNCIRHDKQNDNSFKCIECEENYFVVNQGLGCCKKNYIWNGKICIYKYNVLSNCKEIDLDTNLCKTCKDGYYIYKNTCVQHGKILNNNYNGSTSGSIDNCNVYDDDNVCQSCSDDYQLQNQECLLKVGIKYEQLQLDIDDIQQNCAAINITNFKCVQCLYDYYLIPNHPVCCKLGQKQGDTSACEDNTDQTCLKVDTNGDCILNTNQQNNCQVYTTECIKCNLGYIKTSNGCEKVSEITSIQNCTQNKINKNCLEIDANNCKCTSCRDWAYGDHCCSYGTKWDDSQNKCINITNEYCAEWDGTNNKCTQCFFDFEFKLIKNEAKWIIKEHKGLIEGTEILDLPSSYEKIYLNDSDQCCPIGRYYNGNLCQKIDIKNCRKSQDGSTCNQCNFGYKSLESDTVCCKFNEKFENGNCVNDTSITDTCDTDYYQSNNHCVPYNYYYDILEEKEQPLIDPNCQQSNSQFTCTTCADTYELTTYYQKAVIDIKNRPQSKGLYKEIYFNKCILTSVANNLLSLQKSKDKILQCQLFENGECTKCKNGYYKVRGICCQEGSTALQSNGRTYCISLTNLFDDNCLSQSSTTLLCEYCKSDYIVSYGRCCLQNQYYDVDQNQCVNIQTNCQVYNTEIKVCNICKEGYVKFQNHCVQDGNYYNTENEVYESVNNLLQGCSNMTDTQVCLIPENNYYIHINITCQDGQYNNNGTCSNISDIDNTFQDCLQLNFYDDCQKCNSPKYLTNGRCCDVNKYYDSNTKQCESLRTYARCLKGNYSNSGCMICEDGYYVGQHNLCVKEGYKVDNTSGDTSIIQLQNCIQTIDNTKCIKCTDQTNYTIVDDQCIDNNNLTQQQTLSNCIQLVTTPSIECTSCASNFYLTNGQCCADSQYHDGTQCTNISDVFQNCIQYTNNTCTKCNANNFYISGNQTCCQVNEYASSSGVCESITLQNCAQTIDNTTCLQCTNGNSLVNGQCQVNNISNCDIGATDTECLICNTGFYLNQGSCVQQDTIENCTTMEQNINQCMTCSNGYYYDNELCCADGYTTKLINSQKVCIKMINSLIECEQYNDGVCQSCGNGKYITQDNCCQENFYFDNTCQQSTETDLQNCKQFIDSTKCKLINNSPSDSCLNNEYLHKEHCCALNKYWDTTDSSCKDITDLNNRTNCSMLNDLNECITCSNGNLSDGLCCQNGFYNLNESCVQINRQNCEKFDGKNCLECSSGSLTSYNKCCDQIFYYSNNTCNDTPNNSQIFDIFEEKIIKCNSGFYVTSDVKVCCQEGQFNNNGTCEAFQIATDCLISQGVDQMSDCKKCINDQLLIDNNLCVSSTKTALVSTGQNLLIAFDKSILINQCTQIDENGKCISCANDGNLQSDVCCNKSNYFSITGQNGECTSIDIQNCEYGNTICQTCANNYFPTNDKSKCCELDSYPTSASDCGTSNSTITENCIEFASVNQTDDDKKKCSTCKDNYHLYTNNVNGNTLCCEEQYIPDFDLMKCIKLGIRINNCLNFDLSTNSCSKCQNENYYISSNNVCCLEEYYHKTKNNLSCTSTDTTVENCSKVIKDNNDNFVCTACKSSYYLTNGNCCQENQYFDNTCKNITDTNCLQTQDNSVCDKCVNTYKRNNNIFCCQLGEFLDDQNQCQSIQIVDNCLKVEDDDQEGKLCEVCQSNYNLTVNKICCKTWEIEINDSKLKCSNDKSLNEQCEIWDRKNVECKQCQSSLGYYMSNGLCCEYGSFNPFGTKDGCINISTIDNCNIYDEQLGCETCKDDYILNTSKRDIKSEACLKKSDVNGFVGCIKGNINLSECIQCDKEYYLHKQKCTPIGQKRNSNSNDNEDDTGIDNCLKVNNDDQCIECQTGYYVTDNKLKCCLNGYYLNLEINQCQNKQTYDTVQNCQQYKDDLKKCKKCNDGYFLIELQNQRNMCINFRQNVKEKCIQGNIYEQSSQNYFKCHECEQDMIEYILEDHFENNLIGYQQLPYCEYYDTTNLFSTSTFTCKKCQNNSLMYLNDQICELRQFQNKDKCIKFQDYDQNTCSQCIEGYYLSQQNNCQEIPKTNCFQYNEITQQCEVCNQGYVLILRNDQVQCISQQTLNDSQLDEPKFYNGYIDSCIQNDQSKDILLGGLDQKLSSLFSTHICKQKDQIPFVSIRFVDNDDIRLSQFRDFESYEILQQNLYSSECLKVENEFFKINIQNFQFPKNCSLGFINTEAINSSIGSVQAQSSKDDIKIFCGACKPGFKPYYSNIKFQVHTCQKISNCLKFGQNFNQCDQCDIQYSFVYNSQQNIIDYSQCIFSNQKNCLVLETNKQICRYCQEGYTLNNEKKCVILKSSFCDNNLHYQQIDSLITVKDIFYIMKYGYKQGCSKCQDQYEQFYSKQESQVCTKQIEHIDQVQNCLYYKNQKNDIQCDQCLPNYIIDINQNCLQMNEVLVTCKLALDKENCEICQDNFIQSSGQCIEKSIQNCIKYQFKESIQQLQCLKCQNEYSLYENQCVQLLENDCLEYNENIKCIQCKQGKILMNDLNGNNYCIDIPYNNNCQFYDSSQIGQGRISCQQCLNGFKKIQTHQELCVPVFYIQNCLEYEKIQDLNNINQKCVKCKDGYYLKLNKCLLKELNIVNCIEYDYQNKQCKKCKNGFYFDQNIIKCIENPNGIQNCEQYYTQNICMTCTQHYYLQDNQCLKVEKIIEFCQFYDQNQICQKCQDKFILFEKQCLEKKAQNCKEFQNHLQCKNCQFGYVLKQDNDNLINCVKIEKPNMDNCLKLSDHQPFQCLICQKGYFPLLKQCMKVETIIDNCEVYDNQQRCELCQRNYILTQDRLNCLYYSKEFYCKQFYEDVQPKCIKCNLYHNLVNDECIKQDFELDLERCEFYEINIENQKICALCKSGYYMNKDFECIENKEIKNQQEINQPNKDDILSNLLSLMIYKIWFTLVFLI